MYPCDDEMLVSDLDHMEISNAEHNGHEHEPGVDYCSPFCVCAITNVERIDNPLIKPFLSISFDTPNFFYLAPFSSGVASGIFQPPRV